MRRFIQLICAFWFAISMTLLRMSVSVAQTASGYSGSPDESGAYAGASHSDASGYAPDAGESRALTEYLKQRKLPLVGAQVLRASDGGRKVVLYGFVGSDFGKEDAAQKAHGFLHDSRVEVDNRINVRPELLASNRPSGAASNPYSAYPPAAGSGSNSDASSSADASAYPGPESYKAQQASPYMQQLTSMMPLIALLGTLGMSIAGGAVGFPLVRVRLEARPLAVPIRRLTERPMVRPTAVRHMPALLLEVRRMVVLHTGVLPMETRHTLQRHTPILD